MSHHPNPMRVPREFAQMAVLVSVGAAAMSFGGVQPGAAASTRPAAGGAGVPAVGEVAPGIDLKDLGGRPVQLSALTAEGPVVVVFLRGWVGYQCPVCTKQVGDLRANAQELAKRKARVLLVYPGPASEVEAKAKEFLKEAGLPANFSFVVDPGLATVNGWHVRWDAKGETAYPSTFIVNREGRVAFSKISHSHGDRASAAEILKALPNP